MSHLGKEDKVENLEFTWGKKRGVGGKKKEVQFYESFTYDGVDYTLHDCVYMYKEGELEPYVGKLIKIWEQPDKTKKVKVQWFFHPSEILNWLGDGEADDNEIFLASGEGAGATNVNPLEAIAGKCNVVCISKDSRNPEPSEQELQMADYIFYRTFDVRHCTISDSMGDKVAGLEVKFVFNRKGSEVISVVPKLVSDKKEDPVACNQTLQLSGKNPPDELKNSRMDGISNHLMEESTDVKGSLVERKSLPGGKQAAKTDGISNHLMVGSADVKDSLVQRKPLPGGKQASGAAVDSDEVATNVGQLGTVDKATRSTDNIQKLTVHDNDAKALDTTTTSFERKTKIGQKGVKSAKDAGGVDERPSKKARVDSSIKLSENRNNNSGQKLSVNSDGNNVKDSAATLTSGGKTKNEVTSLGPDRDPKKKTDVKMTKLSNGKLSKVSSGDSLGEDRKSGVVFEVTRRPDDERSKWFKALPWEERMKSAHEQGTVVHLSNLDPEYTSGEVEDIIWHAFKENCTAKMVQHNAISSPHSGQAFIILKTRGAAERIIKELDDLCLMLSNGRPLVGSIAPSPNSLGKQSTFVGHLFVDKIKLQMQREMREAVSTSHCSQPNTIEYEMAMEWRLLQSRSDSYWKQLYKQQGEELRKLKANLKK